MLEKATRFSLPSVGGEGEGSSLEHGGENGKRPLSLSARLRTVYI
jgi:hypothetical protein